jgi:hypothetical protein
MSIEKTFKAACDIAESLGTGKPQAASARSPSELAAPSGAFSVTGGSNPVSSAEALLAKYEHELKRLKSTREGIDRAIFCTHAKVEAARELIGLPLTPRRGRPRRDAGFPTERQPDSNVASETRRGKGQEQKDGQ